MTRGPRIPQEKRFQVVTLAETMTLSAIARKSGLGLTTVDAILRKEGVRPAAKGPGGPGRAPALNCSAGCPSPVVAWGLCSKCYQARRRRDESPKADAPKTASQPKVNPMRFAEEMYRSRLVDRGGAWHLDGLPIRYSDLMRRVNADHKTQGMAQPLTACEEWLCE